MTAAPSASPPAPHIRLALGVTGHRAGHPGFAKNEARIFGVLGSILDHLEAAVDQARDPAGRLQFGSIRLHTLLADGTDRIAAQMALARGYQLVAPLPFGRRLNCTINSLTNDPADARRLLAGEDALDPQIQATLPLFGTFQTRGGYSNWPMPTIGLPHCFWLSWIRLKISRRPSCSPPNARAGWRWPGGF